WAYTRINPQHTIAASPTVLETVSNSVVGLARIQSSSTNKNDIVDLTEDDEPQDTITNIKSSSSSSISTSTTSTSSTSSVRHDPATIEAANRAALSALESFLTQIREMEDFYKDQIVHTQILPP